jgi:hypothetical protein
MTLFKVKSPAPQVHYKKSKLLELEYDHLYMLSRSR